MTIFPYPTHPPAVVHSWSTLFPMGDAYAYGVGVNPASTAWPSANLTLYIPFRLPWDYPVRRLFWVNGATVSGNVDIALKSHDGASIYHSGTVAASGTNGTQYVSPTPFLLPAGKYVFSIGCSSATHTLFAATAVTAAFGRAMGIRQQVSAVPIPEQWTDATLAVPYYPLVGITRL